jgi:type IV pilus assembly protein PilA
MTKQGKTVLIIAIVGACCVAGVTLILILSAIAIPGVQAQKLKGNEVAALNALRDINIEEQLYNSTYPQHGFACSLSALGGSRQSGPATPEAAQLIEPDLASGHKYGYTFTISNCLKVTIKGQDMVISYKLTAVPDMGDKSGERGYCANENMDIRFDPKGGTNCEELLPFVP